MHRGLVSLAVLLALFGGCTRRPNHGTAQANQEIAQANHEPARPASLPPAGSVDPELTRVASEPQALDRPSFARPSPFSAKSELQSPVVSELAPIAPPPSAVARPIQDETEARSQQNRKTLKPFNPKIADTLRERVSVLPAPPALPVTTQIPASNQILGHKACCVGTATFEPARPALVRRVLGRVPGLRRIHQSPAVSEGYVAPRPAREIRLVLPPDAGAALTQGAMDLKATVDESGRVTRVELLFPKNEELVRLAAYAASTWPFVPAKLNDKAVPGEVTLHFTFSAN